MGKLRIGKSKHLVNNFNVHLAITCIFLSDFQILLDRSRMGKSGCCFIRDLYLRQYIVFLMVLLKSNKNKNKMNYPNTHDCVYLKYGDDPFSLVCEAVLICLQGFQRKCQHDGKLGKFFKHLFVLLINLFS